MKPTRILFVLLAALLACSPALAGPSTTRPRDMVDLCDVDGGRWCVDCPSGGCTQGKTGALCCAGSLCVEWDGGQCGGILGWCENYTTTPDPSTGIDVATCHDT